MWRWDQILIYAWAMFGSDFLMKFYIVGGTILVLLRWSEYGIKYGFLLGILLWYEVNLEHEFEDGFLIWLINRYNMELNMNLVPLKYLELISAMVNLTESRGNRTEYGKLDDLFDGILLRKEDGTNILMAK